MQTEVKLQDPFSYSLLPVIITGMIVAAFIIFIIVRKIIIIRKNAKIHKKMVIEDRRRELTEEEILQIKKEYISQLIKIQEGYDNGQLAMRDTYQRISASIREFVFKVTDIEVHNYTLTDIKRLNMPVLAELVEEYYRPEFERESLGDVKNSIEKTKRAIERWN